MISLNVDITEEEAEAFSHFMKRLAYSDYAEKTESHSEAHRAQKVGFLIRDSLADSGFSPR